MLFKINNSIEEYQLIINNDKNIIYYANEVYIYDVIDFQEYNNNNNYEIKIYKTTYINEFGNSMIIKLGHVIFKRFYFNNIVHVFWKYRTKSFDENHSIIIHCGIVHYVFKL